MIQKYEATWESIKNYSVPEWYQDAKFGIFIHWGVYSVPAFANEWYPRNMYIRGTPEYEHHIYDMGMRTTNSATRILSPCSRPKSSTRPTGLTCSRQAGAKYVMPVAEHHDGFAMYDCSFSQWTAAKMGPKRDIIGELAQAVRREGLVFGLSSHRAEHWWFMNGGMEFDSDVRDPRYYRFLRPGQAWAGHAGHGKMDEQGLAAQARWQVHGRLAGAHLRAGGQIPAPDRLV